jgi:hypothetical protein
MPESGNTVAKPRAITASEEEHSELRNARAIMIRMDSTTPWRVSHSGGFAPHSTRMEDARKIPASM